MDSVYRQQRRVRATSRQPFWPIPTFPVSCFQQLCHLSKIMTRIINKFSVITATPASARASLHSIANSLDQWKAELPPETHLNLFADWASPSSSRAPNVLNLHGVYHSLVNLLYRSFIADGHLGSAMGLATSWKQSTDAA